VSFLRKNHTFCHPTGGSDIGKQKYGSTPDPDRTKISTLPTLPIPQIEVGLNPHVVLA
jgi:hypothetical protein